MMPGGAMLPPSEQQYPRFSFDTKNPQTMIAFLRQIKITEIQLRVLFIHQADPYSAAPDDLTARLHHAPGTDLGNGKGKAWYLLISRANSRKSAHGGSSSNTQRRSTPNQPRQVRGGDGEVHGSWISEGGKKLVQDADLRTVAYWCSLYYKIKVTNQKAGWCMTEFWLEPQDGADHYLVLCKMYRSNKNRHYTQSSTAADAAPGGDVESGASLGEWLDVPMTRAALPLFMPVGTGLEISSSTGIEVLVQRRHAAASTTLHKGKAVTQDRENPAIGPTVVIAFHASSIPTAERINGLANYILSLTEERPVILLSAIGKTTTNIQRAAEKALSCDAQQVGDIYELAVIKELHYRTVHDLGLDSWIVSGLLDALVQYLQTVAVNKMLTPMDRNLLVSICESMSSAIFCAYLNVLGIKAKQYADISFTTTDDFTHGDSLEATYASVAKKLQIHDSVIPVVTGSVGKARISSTITSLGIDVNATIIGKALGLGKIEIWKGGSGLLTGDPNICTNAKSVPYITFDEAMELGRSGAQVMHPESMRLAMEGEIPVIILKNSYNPQEPGTVITQTRDMSKSIISGIVLKMHVGMLDIMSTGVTGQHDFQAQVSSVLQNSGIFFDLEASSGGNICLTLHPWKLCGLELTQQEIVTVVEELKFFGVVHQRESISMISLIGNPQKSSFILRKAFDVLEKIGVNAQKVSQRSSKVMNVSLVVHDSVAKHCLQVLHSAFFEDGVVSKVEGPDNECPVPVNSFAAASSSGVKRKADDDHWEAPPRARQERADTDPIGPDETDRTTFSQDDPMPPIGDGDGGVLCASTSEVIPELHGLAEVAEGSGGPGIALEDIDVFMFSEGDNSGVGDPDGSWARALEGEDSLDDAGVLPVGGGDQAMPQSAPGAVTEVDAAPGSDCRQETEHQLSPGNDLTAVGDLDNVFITEDFPGQHDADQYTQRPIDVDVGLIWVTENEVEPQQQVLVEGGSTIEELLQAISPDVMLGPSPGAGV